MTVVDGREPQTAREVKNEYETMLRESSRNGWEVNCLRRPDEFTGYETQPTREEARRLCTTTVEGVEKKCPLLDLCRQYARTVKPAYGVYGGIAWEDGVQFGDPKPVEDLEMAA